jgi:hypothetical protein
MFGERLRRGAIPEAATAGNQRLYLNGTRVAQMSDTQPIDLNSAALGIGRHVSGIADPFNGHIDEFASRTSSVPTAGPRPPETTRATPVRSQWQGPKSWQAASRHRLQAPV